MSDTPKVMHPSDVESLARQYNLTIPEAETLWQRTVEGSESADTVVTELKDGRYVYRPSYERVPADLSHPLTQVDARAQTQANPAADASQPLTEDPTRPESGPYGPFADYKTADVSPEEVGQQTGVPVDAGSAAPTEPTAPVELPPSEPNSAPSLPTEGATPPAGDTSSTQ